MIYDKDRDNVSMTTKRTSTSPQFTPLPQIVILTCRSHRRLDYDYEWMETCEVQMESDEESEWKSKKVKKSKGEIMSDLDETTMTTMSIIRAGAQAVII